MKSYLRRRQVFHVIILHDCFFNHCLGPEVLLEDINLDVVVRSNALTRHSLFLGLSDPGGGGETLVVLDGVQEMILHRHQLCGLLQYALAQHTVRELCL